MAITRCDTLKHRRIESDSAVLTPATIASTASSATGPTQKLGFLSLPPELRIKIYRYAFVDLRGITFSSVPVMSFRENLVEWEGWCYLLSAQLLRTCKTCLIEGRRILYEENEFVATCPGMLSIFIHRRIGNSWYLTLIKHVIITTGNYWTLGNSNKWSLQDLINLDNLETIKIELFSVTQHRIITAAGYRSALVLAEVRGLLKSNFTAPHAIMSFVRLSSRVQIYLTMIMISDWAIHHNVGCSRHTPSLRRKIPNLVPSRPF
jgi:hypothetical protein